MAAGLYPCARAGSAIIWLANLGARRVPHRPRTLRLHQTLFAEARLLTMDGWRAESGREGPRGGHELRSAGVVFLVHEGFHRRAVYLFGPFAQWRHPGREWNEELAN